jgi:hypothetical protein
VSIVMTLPYMPLPESVPVLNLVHLYAAFSACEEAQWESWWKIALGSLLLAKAMGLAHESLWDAFEPLLVGREGHGAGTPVRRSADMLDKDGRPLGPQSLLMPGTQLRVDAHDGRGFRPFVVPGEPVFPSERKAIEAFFTSDELGALKAAGIGPWEARAREVLPPERLAEIRETYGLWSDAPVGISARQYQ